MHRTNRVSSSQRWVVVTPRASSSDVGTPTSSCTDQTPPWSTLSMPVYSLATAPADSAERPSMNITTYCVPVTIKPTPRFAVALYTHTATARNMLATGRGVLQVLRKQHAGLVPLLGKQSAHDVDKITALEEAGFPVVTKHGVPTLKDALGLIELSIVSLETAGDHHVALCDVVSWENIEGQGGALYTGDLRGAE